MDHTVVAAFFLLEVAIRFSVADHTTCHPIFSEISSLSFATSSDTQFIELSLSEACHKGHSQHLNLNKYGLLVLETRPILLGEPDAFTVKSFVDFNNKKWEKKKGKLEDFYVVGSSLEENSRIDFKFYEFSEKVAKCSRFVNWLNCNKKVESTYGKSITDSFSGEAREPKFQKIFFLIYLDTDEDYHTFVESFTYVKHLQQETIFLSLKSGKFHAHLKNGFQVGSRALMLLLTLRTGIGCYLWRDLEFCFQVDLLCMFFLISLLKTEASQSVDMDIGLSDQASDDDQSRAPAGYGEPMDVNDAEEVAHEITETRIIKG